MAIAYTRYTKAPDEWVGQYPSHWTYKRAVFLLTARRVSVATDALEGKTVFHYSIPNVQEYGTGAVEEGSDIDSAKLGVSEPVLLVSKLNPYKITVCIATPHPEYITVASGEFVPIKSDHFDLDYARYVWSSAKLANRLTGLTQSVTRSHQRVSPEEITKIPWAWPPISEQAAIVSFLNHEVARVDTLLEKKRRLLALLEEKRLATITNAVTKGLNPSAPMKHSGSDWLGQIPAHWAAKRQKFISPKITVGIVVTPSAYYSDEGIPALRGFNVKERFLDLNDLAFITPEANELHAKSKIFEGDIVAVRTGQPGTTAIVPADLDGANCVDLIIVRRAPGADVRFLAYFANSDSAKVQYGAGSEGALQQHFNIDTAKSLVVPLPPFSEQTQIANYLDREEAKIKAVMAKMQTAVDTLEEYRSALITNAVTGKIDVSNYARKETAA